MFTLILHFIELYSDADADVDAIAWNEINLYEFMRSQVEGNMQRWKSKRDKNMLFNSNGLFETNP